MGATGRYIESDVSTQQRGKLVVLLYDGAIKFLRIARQKLDQGDYAQKGIYISKARDIVAELNNALDLDAGGQLAKDLRSLYNFLCRHLSEANIERDAVKLDECVRVLEELRGAGDEVARTHSA